MNRKNVAFYGVCVWVGDNDRHYLPAFARKHFIQLEFCYSMHMASNIPRLIPAMEKINETTHAYANSAQEVIY